MMLFCVLLLHMRILHTAALTLGLAGGALAGLNQNQVLVIYNSQNADSQAIYNHYLSVHPNVLGLNLNTTFSSGNTIPYSEYISKIRDPIRTHLTNTGLTQQVTVMTLTKGIPHRIDDTDNPGVGDMPTAGGAGNEFNTGDATYATVDSELTLLWRTLNTGESGGTMDSFSDNLIFNPYHAQTQTISNFSRANINGSKSFVNFGNADVVWQMREGPGGNTATDGGDMYLTTRLDGYTAAQVITSINNAQKLVYNRAGSKIIFDENDATLLGGRELDNAAMFSPDTADPAYEGNDYEEAHALIAPTWSNITLNQNAQFLTGLSAAGPGFNDPGRVMIAGQIAALLSLGGNHDINVNNQNGFLDTFAGQLAKGAILNTIESYNAKDFGGAGGFADLGQLAKWIELGGTFGVGNAYEPFTLSVADNEFLLQNFLNNRLTWAEAAWSSIPYVSWQQLVIGDPLAIVTQEGDADYDGDIDLSDLGVLATNYGTTSGALWDDGDFDFDGDVDLNDLGTLATNYGAGSAQALADFQMLTVPEPAGAALGILAAALLLKPHRNIRKRGK